MITPIGKGTQIIYIPTHAKGFIRHQDVEIGFVTSLGRNGDVAFCRYWSKSNPDELRTKANSEATPIDLLHRPLSDQLKPQEIIDNLLSDIDGIQIKEYGLK